MADQQQQNVDTTYDRDEEYRRAQQAASEAVMVGRETLEAAVHQGEQLERAEKMADETEYIVDKANRVLRGMTWSGWLANKFSNEVESPEYKTAQKERRSILGPPKSYEDTPPSCALASQAVQNYHLNLQVLENCETEEQTGTCRLICDDMHRQARLQITQVLTALEKKEADGEGDTSKQDGKAKNFALQLQEDTQKLRQRQLILQQSQQGPRTPSATSSTSDEKRKLFGKDTNSTLTKTGNVSLVDKVTQQQDEHLNIVTQHLQELGSLAGNLNMSLLQQSEVLDSLDTKNENLHFKTNTMNRRTERFIKDKSWGQPKAEFLHYASIQHQLSGRYLAVAPNNNSTLVLNTVLNERCIFGIYQKKRVIGLQNKYSRKWVGQGLMGQLTCSANAFQRREEWEIDGEPNDTTLLIVSAGWGNGGYLLLDQEGKGTLPIIGGGDIATKKIAPKWCIREFTET